jgi:gliding motility-associated-like protein
VPIQITVIDPNIKTNPPISNPDVEITLENTAVKTSVLLNDRATNIGAVLNQGSLVISKNPANGKAVTNPDGTITYTPAPGFVGTDSLIYSICDNAIPASCKNAVVYYTVKPAGLSPVTIAADDYVSTYQKTAYGNLLSNDKNTGANNNLTISSYNKPLASQGVLVINPDGTYSFTPAPGFVGPIDIIYTVCGGTPQTCANATLHILVKPLIPTQIFDIRKSASGIKLNMDGSFNISFNIQIKNLTNESIDSISIQDDLTKVFSDIKGVKVLSVTSSGLLINNNSYDGITNIELLSISSSLNAYKTDSIIILVNVENNNSGSFLNIATLKAPMSLGMVDLASTDPARLSSDSTKRVPTLFLIPKVELNIPEGFSPNNDGVDDTWIIKRPFGTKIAVWIYNRWGNQVFRNEDYNNDWRGKGVSNFLGEELPEGTYFYIVHVTNITGELLKLAGSLTLKR